MRRDASLRPVAPAHSPLRALLLDAVDVLEETRGGRDGARLQAQGLSQALLHEYRGSHAVHAGHQWEHLLRAQADVEREVNELSVATRYVSRAEELIDVVGLKSDVVAPRDPGPVAELGRAALDGDPDSIPIRKDGFVLAHKADGYGAISAFLGVVGSAGMGVFAIYALGGVAMPVLGVISLACLLTSGAVSFIQVLESGDSKMSKVNKVCRGIDLSVRADVLGKYMELRDGMVLLGMEDLERLASEALLPNAKNDYWVVSALAKAGLSQKAMQDVVNSSSLATTPFGPGLSVPAFR